MHEIDGVEAVLANASYTDDVARVSVRNKVLGWLGFTNGEADPAKFSDTRLMLEALGLDWVTPEPEIRIQELSKPEDSGWDSQAIDPKASRRGRASDYR